MSFYILTRTTSKMAQCSAIKQDGHQCTHPARTDGMCQTHVNSRTSQGPHKFEKMQLKNVHNKQMKDLRDRIAGGPGGATRENLMQYDIESRELRANQRLEIQRMENRHYQEILQTGVNPDREAAEIRRQRNAARRADRIRRAREMVERFEANRLIVQGQPAPVDRDLRNFVNDGQNVHTTQAVRLVKDIIAKVRTIPVPEAYCWNRAFVSPTIGEIISECKLTAHAAAQMFNKYVSPETIYNMEEGIYGKVLDSVWQFIKNSPDKECLCKIMKQELEDNIGMCAQGNLSRICNVLSGYMDGIGSQESISERLGRLFPPLMDIDDDDERRRAAEGILTENSVPRDQWRAWMDAVLV